MLFDETQVLWRDDKNSPWYSLDEENTSVLFEDGKFFIRASVDHLSQAGLAKSIQSGSPYHEEVVSGFRGSPKKRQLELVNATSRPLMFVVMPTSVSNKAFHTFEGRVTIVEGEAKMTIHRSVQQSCVLREAINPQVLQVGPRATDSGP